MTEELQGWHPDPFGRHEWRYFSAGRATFLVRDGRVEGSDPVEDIPPQTHPPSVVAAISEPAQVWALATPPTEPVPAIAAPASQPDTASGHGAPRRGRRGHNNRTAVLAAITAVLVVVFVAVAANGHHPRPTAGSSSITSPTAVSSPTTAATSPSTAVGSPAGGAGAMVASSSGHFAARFPSEPIQQSFDETIAGVHALIQVAAVRSPLTEVAEEDLSSAVSSTQQALALRSAIAVAAVLQTFARALAFLPAFERIHDVKERSPARVGPLG